MDYEYLEHTADAKFRAFGADLDSAFTNAARATFAILYEPEKVKPVDKKEFSLKTKRIETLLYDFLEELLFLLDVDGFLLSKVESINITKSSDDKSYTLECTVIGDTFKNYEVGGNIKSVTYNDMNVKKTDKGYELTVVVDI